MPSFQSESDTGLLWWEESPARKLGHGIGPGGEVPHA